MELSSGVLPLLNYTKQGAFLGKMVVNSILYMFCGQSWELPVIAQQNYGICYQQPEITGNKVIERKSRPNLKTYAQCSRPAAQAA